MEIEQSEKKPKRQPNRWQIYIKGRFVEQKDNSLAMRKKASICGESCRSLKVNDPKKLDEIIDKIRSEGKVE